MPYSQKDFPPSEDMDRIAREDEWFKILNSDTKDHDQLTDKGKFRLREFFENDDEKAKVLDRVDNIGPSIVEAGTDFLFGEPYVVQVEDETLQDVVDDITDRNKLQKHAKESSRLYQGIGHAHFKVYLKNGEAVVEEIPYSFFYPNWSGVPSGANPENVRIVVPLDLVDENNVTKKYLYVEDYFMENGKAVIEYAAYEDKHGKIGAPVDPAKIGYEPKGDQIEKHERQIEGEATKTRIVYIQRMELDELPIITVDRPKTGLHRYGQSIFKQVEDQLNEINDRLTQVSLEFLKHLNAILILPEGRVPMDKDGNVDRKQLQVFFATIGEVDAKYLTDENPMMESAFEHMKNTIRTIAKRTKTPDDFLIESEKGGIEKSETVKTRLMQFFKRIANDRQNYHDALTDLYRIALKLEKKWNKGAKLKITFDYGLPKDWQHDVEVWSAALDSGLASRETAVQRFQGLQDDELQDELQKIETEEKKQMEARVHEVLQTSGTE